MSFWQWFTLITGTIGVVAFLIAVQPFLQFIWGRPRIEVEFGARDKESSRYLDIFIFNRPVKNWFLRLMKVRRDKAEDIFAICDIENIQTNQVVIEQMFPKISYLGKENHAISLPGTSTPAAILLAGANNDGRTIVFDEHNGVREIPLVPGTYRLCLKIRYGENVLEKQGKFKVGVKPYELCWDDIRTS